MTCSNCSRTIDPSSSFCDFCGTPVDTGTSGDTASYGAPYPREPQGDPWVTSPPDLGPPDAGPPDSGRPDAGSPVVAPGTLPVPQPGAPPDRHWPGGPAGMGPAGTPAPRPAEAFPRLSPPPSPSPAPGPPAPPSPGVLPGSPILLGYQERILRQYGAVQLRNRAHGEGTLYVTDSRVVFYAKARGRGTQRGSTLIQQTSVADITGITAYVSRRVSLALFFLACTFLLFGLSSLFVLPPVAVFWFILAVICVIALVGGAAKRGSTGVIINSRNDGHSPISFGTFSTRRGFIGSLTQALGAPFFSLFGIFTVFDVLDGYPGRDSSQIISELGALILDIQTRGDLAYSHYGLDRDQQPARG